MDISAKDAQRITKAAIENGLIPKTASLTWPIRRLQTRLLGDIDSPLTNIEVNHQGKTIYLLLVQGYRIPIYEKDQDYHLAVSSVSPAHINQMIDMASKYGDEGALAALSGLIKKKLNISLQMDSEIDIQHQLTQTPQNIMKTIREYRAHLGDTFQIISFTLPDHIQYNRMQLDKEDNADIDFELYKIDQTGNRQPAELQDVESLPLLCEIMVEHGLIKRMLPDKATYTSKLGTSKTYEADTMRLQVIETNWGDTLRSITQCIRGHLINTRYFINGLECQRSEIIEHLLGNLNLEQYKDILERHVGPHYPIRLFLPELGTSREFTPSYSQPSVMAPIQARPESKKIHELFIEIISVFFKHASWKPIESKPYHLLIGQNAFACKHPALDIGQLMSSCLDAPSPKRVLLQHEEALGLDSYLYLSDMVRYFLKRSSPLYMRQFLIMNESDHPIDSLVKLAQRNDASKFLDEIEYEACGSAKLHAANMLLKYFSYLIQKPFSDLSGTTPENLYLNTLSTFAPAYGFTQEGWRAIITALPTKYPLSSETYEITGEINQLNVDMHALKFLK